jgi:Skp family chaperone for outer membrane proteins
LKKAQEEFKTLRDASQNIALSDAERENRRLNAQDKYKQVSEKEAELRQYTREKQRQLRDDFEKMRTEILDEIRKAVRERCSLEGYSLVLDKSGMTLNNIPAIVYYNPSMEITDGVIKDLNRGHEQSLEQPKNSNAASKEPSVK